MYNNGVSRRGAFASEGESAKAVGTTLAILTVATFETTATCAKSLQ
ncbi:MAG: hypothetical protein IJE77_11865 [Thermoguttaceae bacterium]|nr:hypothetical protein [Thermoguttaceae bacterium]